MPSSHSQFTWFCSAYMILFTLFRLTNTSTWKSLTVVSCLTTGLVMSFSRVYLEYHTVSQVVWGAVVGQVGALLWFIFTQLVLSPLYPRYVTAQMSSQILFPSSRGEDFFLKGK